MSAAEFEKIVRTIAAKSSHHFFATLAVASSGNCAESLQKLEKAKTLLQVLSAFEEAAYSCREAYHAASVLVSNAEEREKLDNAFRDVMWRARTFVVNFIELAKRSA
jgi:hypothetical protein